MPAASAAREQIDEGQDLDKLNDQVAEYVSRMDESDVMRYLTKYVLKPEPVSSTASWRRPPPSFVPDVHDLGACLCGCSDALWEAETMWRI